MSFPLSQLHAKIRTVEGPGEWFGKAFAPIPHGRFPGQGYNLWFQPGGLVRTLRFAGEVAASLVDGKPALMGYSSEFRSHNQDNGMTNEVRKLKDGLFVGIISTAKDHAYWGRSISKPVAAGRMLGACAARAISGGASTIAKSTRRCKVRKLASQNRGRARQRSASQRPGEWKPGGSGLSISHCVPSNSTCAGRSAIWLR